jgi:hypothetical protein
MWGIPARQRYCLSQDETDYMRPILGNKGARKEEILTRADFLVMVSPREAI